MEDFEINLEINSKEICGNFPKNIQMGRGRGEREFGREGEKRERAGSIEIGLEFRRLQK